MELTTTRPEPLVVRSSVRVRLGREAAFALFTADATRWWPLASHSVFDAQAASVTFEPWVGGRIVETATDGRTEAWGVISAWDAGHRFESSWHPGLDPSEATHLEVNFSDAPGGGTQVDLVHTGWEARGAEAAERVAGYELGWKFVLGRYVAVGDA
jgi:uncharacterized protein YndB with AHSA1/START domain